MYMMFLFLSLVLSPSLPHSLLPRLSLRPKGPGGASEGIQGSSPTLAASDPALSQRPRAGLQGVRVVPFHPLLRNTCLVHVYVHVLMRDEKVERKKQARSNKQARQSNTAYPRHSLFLRKMSCLACTCILEISQMSYLLLFCIGVSSPS